MTVYARAILATFIDDEVLPRLGGAQRRRPPRRRHLQLARRRRPGARRRGRRRRCRPACGRSPRRGPTVASAAAADAASTSTMRSICSSVITSGGQNVSVSAPMARVITPPASIRSRIAIASWSGRSPAAHTAPSPRAWSIVPSAASACSPSPRRLPTGTARSTSPSRSMIAEVGEPAGARRRVARVRVAVAQDERRVRLQRAAHRGADEHAAERLVARRHRLGERRQVGHDAVVVGGEPRAEPAEAR